MHESNCRTRRCAAFPALLLVCAVFFAASARAAPGFYLCTEGEVGLHSAVFDPRDGTYSPNALASVSVDPEYTLDFPSKWKLKGSGGAWITSYSVSPYAFGVDGSGEVAREGRVHKAGLGLLGGYYTRVSSQDADYPSSYLLFSSSLYFTREEPLRVTAEVYADLFSEPRTRRSDAKYHVRMELSTQRFRAVVPRLRAGLARNLSSDSSYHYREAGIGPGVSALWTEKNVLVGLCYFSWRTYSNEVSGRWGEKIPPGLRDKVSPETMNSLQTTVLLSLSREVKEGVEVFLEYAFSHFSARPQAPMPASHRLSCALRYEFLPRDSGL